MTRSGPEERLTVTKDPNGIMSPAALRVLSLTTSSACSRKLGSAWAVTGYVRPNALKSLT